MPLLDAILLPSQEETDFRTPAPTSEPLTRPIPERSAVPSYKPSSTPTIEHSTVPSYKPSSTPTHRPSSIPSYRPSSMPTQKYSNIPSYMPSSSPTHVPTQQLSTSPTVEPSSTPSLEPSTLPSRKPTDMLTYNPSFMPSETLTLKPSELPSYEPSLLPSTYPSNTPSRLPSSYPSNNPTLSPSTFPSDYPSLSPSIHPSDLPSLAPTFLDVVTIIAYVTNVSETYFTEAVIEDVEARYTSYFQNSTDRNVTAVSVEILPSGTSARRSLEEDSQEYGPTMILDIKAIPDVKATQVLYQEVEATLFQDKDTFENLFIEFKIFPLYNASRTPTSVPSDTPTVWPSDAPTMNPTVKPSLIPSASPTSFPTRMPTIKPTNIPSVIPSDYPSDNPSSIPSYIPTRTPTSFPSEQPSSLPTVHPTSTPSRDPSFAPSVSHMPSSTPSSTPTTEPTTTPSRLPSTFPSVAPSLTPPEPGLFDVTYNLYSNSSEITETDLINSQLQTIDAQLFEVLTTEYNRDDCTYFDCRRDKRILNANDRFDIQPLIINDVKSIVNTTEECADSDHIKDGNTTTCYVISTSVNVTRYPVKFGEKRTGLIVKAAVMDYVQFSGDFQLVHVEPEPEKLETNITLQFEGVDSEVMDDYEQELFLQTFEEFVDDLLGEYREGDEDSPILLYNVSVVSQAVIVSAASRSVNQNATYALEINMTIFGEYEPPPVITFDEVIIEVLDTDTAEEDFIEKIEKSNNTYFEDKNVEGYKVGITTVSADIISRSDGEHSSIFEESYILPLLLSLSSIILIIIALIWRRKVRVKNALRRYELNLETQPRGYELHSEIQLRGYELYSESQPRDNYVSGNYIKESEYEVDQSKEKFVGYRKNRITCIIG